MNRRLVLGAISAALFLGAGWLHANVRAGSSAPYEETSGPLATPGFHHVHLNVADLDAAFAFYTKYFPMTSRVELLGFPTLNTGQMTVLFTKLARPPRTEPQSAYWHYGWRVANPTEYWERYVAEKAPLMPLYTDTGDIVTFSGQWWAGLLTKAEVPAAAARGIKMPPQGAYSYLRGPAGEIIEVEAINHVHMFQDEPYCAELWYKRHLNAPISRASRRGARPGEPTWRPPDVTESDCRAPLGTEPSWLALTPAGMLRQPNGGVIFDDVEMNWYHTQGKRPLASSKGQVMDHVGLSVKNLDAWYAKLRNEGVTVVAKPYRLGNTRAFMIEGPSRERLELVQVK